MIHCIVHVTVRALRTQSMDAALGEAHRADAFGRDELNPRSRSSRREARP